MLQRNLRDARETMQSTMVQAADDVLILTQKLQEVEEKFAQCRVDKDHLETELKGEMELMRGSVNDAHERLLSSRRETQDRVADLKASQREIERLMKECQEAENSSKALEHQMSLMQDEMTNLKATRSRLEREVLQLQGEVSLEKSNVRNEIQRAQMERESNKERVVKLQVQLEQALNDSAQIEDFKAENVDLKRRVAMLQNQLKALEDAKAHSEQTLRDGFHKEKQEMMHKYDQETEDLRAQLRCVYVLCVYVCMC